MQIHSGRGDGYQRAITTSLTLASLLLVGLLSPSLAQPTAILGRKEDVMVLVLAFEISLALIIAFVVLRSQSASLVGRRNIRSDVGTLTVDLLRTAHSGLSSHWTPAPVSANQSDSSGVNRNVGLLGSKLGVMT